MSADTWTPPEPVTCPEHDICGWLDCMDFRAAYEARCAYLGRQSRPVAVLTAPSARRASWWRRAWRVLRATTRPHGGPQ